jgi:hypothetical protein
MSLDLYTRCSICNGQLKVLGVSESTGAVLAADCPCKKSRTPGWSPVGLNERQLERWMEVARKVGRFFDELMDSMGYHNLSRTQRQIVRNLQQDLVQCFGIIPEIRDAHGPQQPPAEPVDSQGGGLETVHGAPAGDDGAGPGHGRAAGDTGGSD